MELAMCNEPSKIGQKKLITGYYFSKPVTGFKPVYH